MLHSCHCKWVLRRWLFRIDCLVLEMLLEYHLQPLLFILYTVQMLEVAAVLTLWLTIRQTIYRCICCRSYLKFISHHTCCLNIELNHSAFCGLCHMVRLVDLQQAESKCQQDTSCLDFQVAGWQQLLMFGFITHSHVLFSPYLLLLLFKQFLFNIPGSMMIHMSFLYQVCFFHVIWHILCARKMTWRCSILNLSPGIYLQSPLTVVQIMGIWAYYTPKFVV